MGFTEVMDGVSKAFEAVGVVLIVIGFVTAIVRAVEAARRTSFDDAYEVLRATFGRSVLLGLEVLVAADIIRTVAVQLTLDNLIVLAVLVTIRTFLSWSFEVEIDGHWPWEAGHIDRRRRR